MAWTREHFDLVAEILANAPVGDGVKGDLAYAFAVEFKRRNQTFKPQQFFDAVGVDPAQAH